MEEIPAGKVENVFGKRGVEAIMVTTGGLKVGVHENNTVCVIKE